MGGSRFNLCSPVIPAAIKIVPVASLLGAQNFKGRTVRDKLQIVLMNKA